MIFNHTHLLMADEFHERHLTRVNMAQLKMNGLRLLVTKTHPVGSMGVHEIEAVTREGKTDFWPDLQKIESIRERVEALPVNTALDCEIHVPGVPETSMKTLLKAGDQRLTLSPFAVPYFDGVDMMGEAWSSVAKLITTLGFIPPETIPGKLTTGDVDRLLAQARERSIEGWVLKIGHYHGWYKLKPVKTFDAVVTAVLPGEGKHKGRMGALEVSLYDHRPECLSVEGNPPLRPVCNVGTGFTDVERTHIWQNPQGTVGKVVEVVYDSLAANGAPKFPRFKRFRDDKEAQLCSMKQIKP